MLIFAHRGASGYAPENTIKAMQQALELGATAVELDVYLVEGELMVFHDRKLDGISDNGQGLISHKTLSQLSQVTVGGEPIPSLWQLMSTLSPRPLVNIELKGKGTVEALITLYPKLINELGYSTDTLLISSFNHRYLQQFKQAIPSARIAPLIEGIPMDLAACAERLSAYSLHLDIGFITAEIVADAHRRGIKVYVYTVDSADDIRYLQQIGADGVFSNYPDKTAAML